MALESVTIAGTVVDPCWVDTAAVIITHGRAGVADGPTASTAVLAFVVPEMPTWRVADPIAIAADGMTRFTGRIADIELTHVPAATGEQEAVLEVTCIGPVADLGRRQIGDQPWPLDSSSTRATRILTAANVPAQVEGNPALTVNPRDVDARTALDLVTDLAEDVGAAVFDTPDGLVVFQHYQARAQTWAYHLWREAPGTWSETPAWFPTWADTATESPSAPTPVEIPCDVAAWEPTWVQTDAQVINDVTIGYGVPPQGQEQDRLTADNPESITRFGRLHYGNDTQLADSLSAGYRAGMILDRHATPRWGMAGLDVWPDDMDPTLRDQVLALLCGKRIMTTGLPAPAPSLTAVGVVEGWTHTLTPTLNQITFNLSDPLHSYAGIVWAALNPGGRWTDVDPALPWYDALNDPATI